MSKKTNSQAVRATYTPQKFARMQGNILIEALPPSLPTPELLRSLASLPDFTLEQREYEDHERVQQIKTLQNCLIPLDNHVELARTLDVMLREGYVGREPGTAASQARLQAAYELQKDGKTFSQTAVALAVRDSVALIGVPGMGKSTTARRALNRYPPVIDHGGGVVQIPVIHVDMTSNGTSVKSLAIAIISEIDRRLPECGYAGLYLASTGRTSTEALIHAAGRLVALHHVGLIVADELQNLTPTKGVQTVMTELVTMCNTFAVPLVFIGTYKAQKILGADFRAARRGTGGLSSWGPMPRYDSGVLVPRSKEEPSEWADFLQILWKFQWIRNPQLLTTELIDYLHDRTQGVIDLVLKMFAIAQVRAITSGAEELSRGLFDEVYKNHFGLLHEALEAMRRRKKSALEQFADVAPFSLDAAARKYEVGAALAAQSARGLRPGHPEYAPEIANVLTAGGIRAEDAAFLASEAERANRPEGPLEAAARIVNEVRPRATRKPANSDQAANVVYPDFANRPRDYRRALALAAQTGTKVVEQMGQLGMLWKPEPPFVPV